MQVLNFIPSDYIARKRARKANMLCAMLTAVVVAVLALLLVVVGMAEESVTKEADAMEAQVQAAASRVSRWRTFQETRRALLGRAEEAARLLSPLPRSRIVAEVMTSLPERASLTDLSVKDETVQVIVAPEEPAGGRSRRGKKAKPDIRQSQETHLRLLGLAPTDVEVAQFIAELSSSKLFDQVELSYTEDQQLEGRLWRRFEVRFRLHPQARRVAMADGTAAEDS